MKMRIGSGGTFINFDEQKCSTHRECLHIPLFRHNNYFWILFRGEFVKFGEIVLSQPIIREVEAEVKKNGLNQN
jgi:hypothetical protein